MHVTSRRASRRAGSINSALILDLRPIQSLSILRLYLLCIQPQLFEPVLCLFSISLVSISSYIHND